MKAMVYAKAITSQNKNRDYNHLGFAPCALRVKVSFRYETHRMSLRSLFWNETYLEMCVFFGPCQAQYLVDQ